MVTSDAGMGWSGVQGSGGIAKKFVTGTEVRVEAGDVYGFSGDFRDDYLSGQAKSDLTMSIRQPLLRGANWEVNRSGIKLAELLKEQATASKTAEVLDMLRAAETAYWTAAVAREVRERQQFYAQAGIRSVPAIIINDKHLISGGQPVEVFEQALRRIALGEVD